MFQNLGEQWSITKELCVQLESFVCAMYGMKKGNRDVNQWRYAVFCSKKHINYRLVATAYTITAREPIPNRSLEERMDIVWMSGSPAPKAVIELLAWTVQTSQMKCHFNQRKMMVILTYYWI